MKPQVLNRTKTQLVLKGTTVHIVTDIFRHLYLHHFRCHSTCSPDTCLYSHYASESLDLLITLQYRQLQELVHTSHTTKS
jgi:hypothetical protein